MLFEQKEGDNIMYHMKKKLGRFLPVLLLFVLAFAMTAWGAEEEAEYVPAVCCRQW